MSRSTTTPHVHQASEPPPATTGDEAEGELPLVPSRRQYLDLKALHPEAMLLYRLGDFYETFDDDAKMAARDARITLTSRDFGRSGRVPMAGIPHHALNHYLGRLLAAGHTVAIAEQLSPAGRGLVERGVTRVLTPGTVAESALLPAGENRYLAAVARSGGRLGMAWVDVSTGEFAVVEFAGPDAAARLSEEIARLDPAEVLLPDLEDDAQPLPALTAHRTRLERWHFEPHRARAALCRRFGVGSLTAYGCDDAPAATGAAGAILEYLARTNPRLLPLLTGLRTEVPGNRVGLDAATRHNLELTRSHRTGGRRGSLLSVLDETRTAMGARALRRLLGQPSRDLAELNRRQGIVAGLVADGAARTALGEALSACGDLERLVGQIARGQPSARELLSLGAALRVVPAVTDILHGIDSPPLLSQVETLDACSDVLDIIDRAVEETPTGVASVRTGFDARLDDAVNGVRETRRWLAGLERCERERTGIRSLKVGYNKVFGYYIEVTRPNLDLVPDEYVRKQTVATGERYVTTPLKEAEAKILAADEEIAALERTALERVAGDVVRHAARLVATANRLARLDAFASLAEIAARNRWVAPELSEGTALTIVGGRHPVVDVSLGRDAFIANDCLLGDGRDQPRVVIVTGPNMGGKSTYLRQVAVIVLLAQIGSFVPAERAKIGVVDRIFTRVGAHDDLPGGRSTFMVEMVETATILRQATARSLVILDELGRGTGTADGIALARAVLEDVHGRVGARALLATHFLELTELAGVLPGVANAHVAALETEDGVVFLYAVRPGPAARAYGVHVARLAGLPPWVVNRANDLLERRDEPDDRATDRPSGHAVEEPVPPYEASPPADATAKRLANDLRELDVDNLTPRQAIDWLFEQQERL